MFHVKQQRTVIKSIVPRETLRERINTYLSPKQSINKAVYLGALAYFFKLL